MVKKLNLAPDDEFILLGILSQEKDYKLCFEINKWLGLQFEKHEDYELLGIKNRMPSSFSKFAYESEEDAQELFLFCNRGSVGFLIPEYKNVDYFLMIKGNVYEEDKESLISKLKRLPSVQGVYEIDSNSIKSKENLIF